MGPDRAPHLFRRRYRGSRDGPGFEETKYFAIQSSLVFDVHRRVLRPDDVECRVIEGRMKRVSLLVCDQVRQARRVRQHVGDQSILVGQIEARDMTSERRGEMPRRAADARA
jgi:hypothetical protein